MKHCLFGILVSTDDFEQVFDLEQSNWDDFYEGNSQGTGNIFS